MTFIPLETEDMQREIFSLLKELRNTQVTDGITIATLKANQEHQKEDLMEIKHRISSIEEIDKDQSSSLNEHMRRTEASESAIEILKDQCNTTIEDYKAMSEKVTVAVAKLETPTIGKIFKDNIKWIVGIITTLAGAAAGIGALLNLL